MKRIRLALVAIVAVLSAAWQFADSPWPQPFGYFAFRTVFMQYSGVLAIGLMSAAMLLALRPRWLEPHLDGLDKMYRLHKWLGIAALVVSVLHWWWAQGTKWMVGWGWLLAVLMAAGSAAAVIVLLGRVGAGRRVKGRVASITHYPALDVLETSIALDPGWPGHAAGQFAFVTSDRREGAHPYTIASAWLGTRPRITFITKALGDHTRRLRERLHVGMPVTVEGTYGCFDFDDDAPRQIWIGAGIGITPFIARMKQLAEERGGKTVDLFHPTAVLEPAAIGKLTADAEAAGVRLHVIDTRRDGRLDGERIRAAVPGWADASLWFCGPATYGEALRADFVRHLLPVSRFHQELFEMR